LGDTRLTLTVRNFIDLKCLIATWDKQHKEAPGQVLTKVEWVNRHSALMSTVMSIESAETFKMKEETVK